MEENLNQRQVEPTITTTVEYDADVSLPPQLHSNMDYEATRLDLEQAMQTVDSTRLVWMDAVRLAIQQADLVSKKAEAASEYAANLAHALSDRAQVAAQDAQRLARESREAADAATHLRAFLPSSGQGDAGVF
jgi:hypothetical protein